MWQIFQFAYNITNLDIPLPIYIQYAVLRLSQFSKSWDGVADGVPTLSHHPIIYYVFAYDSRSDRLERPMFAFLTKQLRSL